jgi:hypothetical protein
MSLVESIRSGKFPNIYSKYERYNGDIMTVVETTLDNKSYPALFVANGCGQISFSVATSQIQVASAKSLFPTKYEAWVIQPNYSSGALYPDTNDIKLRLQNEIRKQLKGISICIAPRQINLPNTSVPEMDVLRDWFAIGNEMLGGVPEFDHLSHTRYYKDTKMIVDIGAPTWLTYMRMNWYRMPLLCPPFSWVFVDAYRETKDFWISLALANWYAAPIRDTHKPLPMNSKDYRSESFQLRRIYSKPQRFSDQQFEDKSRAMMDKGAGRINILWLYATARRMLTPEICDARALGAVFSRPLMEYILSYSLHSENQINFCFTPGIFNILSQMKQDERLVAVLPQNIFDDEVIDVFYNSTSCDDLVERAKSSTTKGLWGIV